METKPEQYVQVAQQDRELGLVYPFCGLIPDDKITIIYKILCNHLSKKKTGLKHDTDMLNYIKCRMSEEKLAVVMNKDTKKTYVNENKRMCLRHTFNINTTSQISDVLIDVIKLYASMQCIVPIDVRFDESHGDILYYKSGGFFAPHRDMVPICPFINPSEWKMYTLIICLDSNLTETINEGSTAVFLPSINYLQDSNYKLNKLMIEHIFQQSTIKNNFLVFPAEALHSSIMITKTDGFKMALKFDMWLRIPTLPPTLQLKPYTIVCKCVLCYHTHQINVYSKQLVSYSRDFERIPFDIVRMISNYLISIPQRECICSNADYKYDICHCTCSDCLSMCPYYDTDYDYDYHRYSDNDECNGYTDTD